METIIKIDGLVPSLPIVGVFEGVRNDSDDVLYPIVLDGKYYHLMVDENGKWNAIGLSDDICMLIGNVIEQELLMANITD